MQSDEGVFKWLAHMEERGVCFVSGVPVTPEDTEKLCERVAHIRETHCKLQLIWLLLSLFTDKNRREILGPYLESSR